MNDSIVVHRDAVTEDGLDFEVYLSAAPSDIPLSGVLPEAKPQRIGQLRARIERGDLVYFDAKVECLYKGHVMATEYLGGCLYKSSEEFIKDPYFVDMKRTVLDAAKAELLTMYKEIQNSDLLKNIT